MFYSRRPSRLHLVLSVPLLLLLASTSLAAAAGVWREIGPAGGQVVEFAPAPGAPGKVYVIAQDGSIFRTSDGAKSWTPTGHLDVTFPVVPPIVTVDPFDASTLYFALNIVLEKSSDGGAHWSHLPLPGSSSIFDQPTALALSPSTPGSIYAALDMTQLFHSGDGGTSWMALSGPDPNGFGIDSLAVDAYDDNRLYASGGSRTLYSQDGGHHWSVAGGAPLGGASKLVADPSLPLGVYGFTFGSTEDPAFKSVDGGVTWSSVSASLPKQGLDLEAGRSGAVYVIASDLFYASPDSGNRWQQGIRQYPFAVDSGTGSRLYGATATGIGLSTDSGQSWMPANQGFTPISFLQLIADPGRPGTLYCVANQSQEPVFSNLAVTTDDGATWSIASDSDPGQTPGAEIQKVAFDARHRVLFVLSKFGVIFRSFDQGATWQFAGSSLFFQLSSRAIDLEVASGNPRTLYTLVASQVSCPPTGGFNTTSCAQYQVFTSHNRGRGWLARGTWYLADPTQDFPAGQLWIDPFAASTVFAGVTAGPQGSALMRSLDGGATWSPLAIRQPVVAAVFDPARPGTLYIAVAGDRRQVLKSTNGGASWQAANGGGLPHGTGVTALAFAAETPYAGTADGRVFATVDGARTWQLAASGLPGLPVLSLAADGHGTAYAGVAGGGLYASTVTP